MIADAFMLRAISRAELVATGRAVLDAYAGNDDEALDAKFERLHAAVEAAEKIQTNR
jgi:hypothetical protein